MRSPLTAARRYARAARVAAVGGLGKLAGDTRGAAAVEYGFVAVLIVVAIMAALISFGDANLDIWRNVSSKVVAAG